MDKPMQAVHVVEERERAEVLMSPLRLRILETARTPGSAAELARRLGESPQKVNYHVRRLSEHGFLRKVEERRAGNVVETVYVATAERYVVASAVLGALSPRPGDAAGATAAGWLALQARAEEELGEALRRAETVGQRVPTFAMDAEFRFETAEQWTLFTRAVRDLFQAAVSKYTSPASVDGGDPAPGGPYRMILGCYPIPREPAEAGGFVAEPEESD